ncbi:ATP-dependent RNA helicase RhlE [Nonlabens sp. MIC269]|uniref:DEAD/DEAH box helicase n=1 Tax=Nonlabens sp. MIC269 TaxID=1476901 RepID=UPI00071F6FC2|nr:DEAD/DEAH box helicase [Nonlabens sp. MIC269]ALM20381.1 ATP-dependent RNA helicase RhlE [Nonlabens sp. MIC269]
MLFKDLGLSAALLKAIDKKGYSQPSPIQEKAIPQVLQGKDVLASAQTGTGKTAGFTLPLLHRLGESKAKKRPVRALILTPTRELAAQVYDNVKEYSEFLNIRSAVIFGGVNQNPQVDLLKKGVDVLVATPGRLIDLNNQGFLKLNQVETLVLDEADRMLDMGFLRDIKRILALLPVKRQNLLFSATFSKEIKKLAASFLNNPVLVEATPENTTAEKVDQLMYRVDTKQKQDVLINMITEGNWSQVLVFTRTKHRANRLAEKLNKSKVTAAAIHGNKSQGARTRALAGFKDSSIRVLVATDIAARGLDIPLLPYVINYELPNVPEDYVHRIGRTGRAGASGQAISLVAGDEVSYVKGIEKLLDQRFDFEIIEGYEPDPNAPTEKPKPKQRGRKNHGKRSSSNRNKNNSSRSNRNKNRKGLKRN